MSFKSLAVPPWFVFPSLLGILNCRLRPDKTWKIVFVEQWTVIPSAGVHALLHSEEDDVCMQSMKQCKGFVTGTKKKEKPWEWFLRKTINPEQIFSWRDIQNTVVASLLRYNHLLLWQERKYSFTVLFGIIWGNCPAATSLFPRQHTTQTQELCRIFFPLFSFLYLQRRGVQPRCNLMIPAAMLQQ